MEFIPEEFYEDPCNFPSGIPCIFIELPWTEFHGLFMENSSKFCCVKHSWKPHRNLWLFSQNVTDVYLQ